MFTLHIPVRILLFNELFVVICFLGNSFERNIKNKYRSLILRHTLFNCCSPLKTENIRSSGWLSVCPLLLQIRENAVLSLFRGALVDLAALQRTMIWVCVCVGERVFRKIWQKSVTQGKNKNNNNVFRPTTHLMFGVRGL